ncbi:gfo/Idh/MocA family oxidoreductase, partial [bacterium]|nr:gfo/Idh/MocA family oxidoreductase [bacterium]
MNIIRTMKQIVDDGVIGAVKAVWVRHFVGAGGGWYFHDWHATKKNATSLFLQKGCHDIDVLHWIAGAYTTRTSAFGGLDYFGGDKPDDLTCPECDIRETCTEAQSAHYLGDQHVQCCFRKEVDVEDNQVMIMNLEGGIRAAYLQCHFAPDTERNYVFIGTEGRMESHWPEMQVRVKTRKSGTWKQYADRTYDIKKAEGGHGGADPVICRDFVDYILDDKEPVAQVYASRMSVAAGVCAADSLRQGGMPVDIPAAPEGFGKGERS